MSLRTPLGARGSKNGVDSALLRRERTTILHGHGKQGRVTGRARGVLKHGIILFLLLILAGCSGPKVTFLTQGANTVISVEVADTNELRTQGLMNRTTLPATSGMLFVFDSASQRTFWMKDTKIPLDMIFIGSDLIVNEVKGSVPPCKEDPCAVYPSLKPAQYVVEVNAGFAAANGIYQGTQVKVP
jgi:uncharacterized membrane protein (UPF0127 family)